MGIGGEIIESFRLHRRGHLTAQEALDLAEGIVDTVREPLLMLSAELRVISANDSFYRNFGLAPEEVEGRIIYQLGNQAWDTPRLRELLEEMLAAQTTVKNFEVDHDFGTTGPRRLVLNARRLPGEADDDIILLAIEDITELGRAEEALGQTESELEIRKQIADLFISKSDEQTYGEVLRVILEAFKSRYQTLDISKHLKLGSECPPSDGAKRAVDPLQKRGRHST